MRQKEKRTPKGTLKRGVATLLTSCMCVSLMPIDAFAAEYAQQEGRKALNMQQEEAFDLEETAKSKAAESEDVLTEEESQKLAESVSYSIDAQKSIYLTAGQHAALKLYGGDKAVTPSGFEITKADGKTASTDITATAATGDIVFAGGDEYVGDVYRVYPQVEIGGNDVRVKDADGNELYYEVTYLGAVRLVKPTVKEIQTGKAVTFGVESEYVDNDELAKLVKEHAEVTYTIKTNNTAGAVEIATANSKTGVLTYATGKGASDLAAGSNVVITATAGSTHLDSEAIYVIPNTKPLVKTISVDKTEITVEKGTSTARANVAVAKLKGANGKDAYNQAMTVTPTDTTLVASGTVAADGKLTLTVDGNKTGSTTVKIASTANSDVFEEVKVTVVEPEPYKMTALCDSFSISTTAKQLTDVKSAGSVQDIAAFTESNPSSMAVKYDLSVSNAFDEDGKAVADASTVVAASLNSDDDIEVVGGDTEGYATLTITGTLQVDESHAYTDTVSFIVYNTATPADEVVFTKKNDTGKEVAVVGAANTKGDYVVGDTFKLTACATNKASDGKGGTTATADGEEIDALKADVSAVNWVSSDESVATVDKDGNVTIVGEGTSVTISAISVSDATKAVKADWTITSAVDLGKLEIEEQTGNKTGAFYVEGDGATSTTLQIGAANSAAVTYDWSVAEGAKYVTFTPTKSGNDQTFAATMIPNKITADYATVDIDVTMTSKLSPSLKQTKSITAYVTKEDAVAPASIKVNDDTLEETVALSTGETMDLTAVVYGAPAGGKTPLAGIQDVTWSSSDESVIKVDEKGTVTAVAASEDVVNVIVSSKVDDAVNKSISFLVSDIAPEKVELGETAVSLKAGEKKEVAFEVKGADNKKATSQEVKAVSSDEKVATVTAAEGKLTVTAVAEGTADITVTSAEDGKVTAKLTVTVTKAEDPAPVDPTPVDPTPVDPTPVDPTPVDPTPVDPTPVDPAPVDPTPGTIAVSEVKVDQSVVAFDTIGATVKVTASVTPDNATNKTVTWTTSNANVANVAADGTITATGNGTATVTAAAEGKTATVTVTVSQKTEKVSITLKGQKASGTLKAKKGAKYQFKAVVTPSNADAKNAAVKWTTSNKKVATVSSNGKVTVKKAGKTVTITATTADGKKASVKLKTQKSAVKATKLAITGKNTMKVKGTQKLKVTVSPVTVDNAKVSWSSSNTKVATVNKNGKVTAKKKGNVTITVKAADGSGKKATFKIKVK